METPETDLRRDFAGRDGAAVVVGASGGLGQEIARMLTRRGSDVALTYHSSPAAVDSLVAEARGLGVRARGYEIDVEDMVGSAAVVEEVVDYFGGIHTVVYAAGPHVPMNYLSAVQPWHLQSQLHTDVAGCYGVLHAALPHLRGSAGSFVAVTTAATSRYPSRDGLSAIPKGAVEQLVKAVAVEEGRFGVRANCVGPGMLTDGMAERLISSGDLDEKALAVAERNIPLRRFGRARDIAEAVCFLASDRAGFISGQKLDVDGGYGA